jgi:uncharacterized protein
MIIHEQIFGAQAALAQHLLLRLDTDGTDGSHDQSHLLRVWHNARAIAEQEPGCDWRVLVAGVLLHDCVAVEKNAAERSLASRLSAERARLILAELAWDAPLIEATAHAIESHSFSADIPPRTLEARILQDADRLDAIGAIGIARCFYVAGRMGSSLYSPDDPIGDHRTLDDRQFALDHFHVKLFRIADNFQTTAGQAMAAERRQTMLDFVRTFRQEVEPTGGNI